MWNPHEPLSARQRQLLGALGIGLLLAIWSAIAASGKVRPYFLPAPWDVADGIVYMANSKFADQQLLPAALASMKRVGLAAALVVLIGVPVGILMGASPKINAVLSPLVDPMRSAPVVAILPIIVLWFGVGEKSKIVFLYCGASVFLIPMTRDAIASVPQQYVELARDLGATPWETIRHAVIPLALPRILDAVIVAVSIEWTYITVAEYVNAEVGLGQLM